MDNLCNRQERVERALKLYVGNLTVLDDLCDKNTEERINRNR